MAHLHDLIGYDYVSRRPFGETALWLPDVPTTFQRFQNRPGGEVDGQLVGESVRDFQSMRYNEKKMKWEE